ncbi:MAG: hypothetical protein ACLUG9_12750 [Paraclostridium sordellii]
MTKKEKVELFEKETRYCKIIRSVELKDGEELFTLEKIYIKALDRYEIRMCLYLDCNDRARKLIPRPADIAPDKFIDLIGLGFTKGILDEDLKEQLKSILD